MKINFGAVKKQSKVQNFKDKVMNYETIELEIKDQVAVIRLNRPDVKNALNTQMRAEITQSVSQMGKEARVVVTHQCS